MAVMTTKQRAFVDTAMMDFDVAYHSVLEAHKATRPEGIGKVLSRAIDRHFEFNRMNRMQGGSGHREPAETGVFGRPMMALMFYRRHWKVKQKQKAQAAVHAAQSPQVEFLGSHDEALTLFSRLMEYITHRFGFAIEKLKNNQSGVQLFAEYIAHRVLMLAASEPGKVKSLKTADEKLKYLVRGLLTHRSKKVIEAKYKDLETELSGEKLNQTIRWSPTAILCKSPIQCKGAVFVYVGKNDHGGVKLPLQRISDDSERPSQNYERDTRFSSTG